MNTQPWFSDLVRQRDPQEMTREQFTAAYFPRYVEPYRIDYRIRLKPNGRCTHPTKATAQAQNTKRTNIIDAAFASYLSALADVRAWRNRQTQPVATP